MQKIPSDIHPQSSSNVCQSRTREEEGIGAKHSRGPLTQAGLVAYPLPSFFPSGPGHDLIAKKERHMRGVEWRDGGAVCGNAVSKIQRDPSFLIRYFLNLIMERRGRRLLRDRSLCGESTCTNKAAAPLTPHKEKTPDAPGPST